MQLHDYQSGSDRDVFLGHCVEEVNFTSFLVFQVAKKAH